MSLISKKSLIQRIRRGRDARAGLVQSNLAQGIAFQVRAIRDKKEWTQERLAQEAGMTQNSISRLESPDYGKYTLTSLKRIADALDVALAVRFVPFSQYIDWLSGTPYVEHGLDSESLAVPSFPKEEENKAFDERGSSVNNSETVNRRKLDRAAALSGTSLEPNNASWPGGSLTQHELKGSENLCGLQQ